MALLIIAIYWYFFACLTISIHENKKISNFSKITIVIIPIVVIISLFLTLAFSSDDGGISRDGRIIVDMNQIRSQAVTIDLQTDDHSTVCANSDIVALIQDIDNYAPTPASCFADSTAYCVTVELNSGDFYCVDSALHSISGASNTCTAENKACQ